MFEGICLLSFGIAYPFKSPARALFKAPDNLARTSHRNEPFFGPRPNTFLGYTVAWFVLGLNKNKERQRFNLWKNWTKRTDCFLFCTRLRLSNGPAAERAPDEPAHTLHYGHALRALPPCRGDRGGAEEEAFSEAQGAQRETCASVQRDVSVAAFV